MFICFQLNGGFSEGLTIALKTYGLESEKTKAFDGLQHEVMFKKGTSVAQWKKAPLMTMRLQV